MKEYQICQRCIMDTSDPDIVFDSKGYCNHCRRYYDELPKRINSKDNSFDRFKNLISKIKEDGKRLEYDCIIGVSGGVDSSYVAHLCYTHGLRPLAVHFDNGWNSELAVSNIEVILSQMNIELYTYVVDWEEFRDLQIAFLYSQTPDGEIPTDHGINALLFKLANKFKIKYIINGMNFKTESLSVPKWSYGHSDWKYIKSVYKKYGSKNKLNSYPHFSLIQLFFYTIFKKIKIISLLNYIDYNKDQAKELLISKYSWRPYSGKHHESVYTKFFQTYYLPKKFNIDKRRGHYSDLINSGDLSREEALELMKVAEISDSELENEKKYILKKFELSENEFDNIMNSPNKYFIEYPNNAKLIFFIKKIVNILRKMEVISK